MPFGTYNNNQNNGPTNTTYSPISFSNPESAISASRFSISYFNKLMKVSIALRNNSGTNDQYATYDTDNQVSVYVSYNKAKILHDMIVKMQEEKYSNVCVELKNGLLKISDGSEYNVNTPCISISYARDDGKINEVVYQTKQDYYYGAYDYNKDTGSFEKCFFNNLEVETFAMVLEQYYEASSYAIANSVMEASMYKRDYTQNLIKQIAEKNGVSTGNRNGGSTYNSKTFLSDENNQYSNSNNGTLNGAQSKEYESATFDDIASGY